MSIEKPVQRIYRRKDDRGSLDNICLDEFCPYTIWLADILLEEQARSGITIHYATDILVKGPDLRIINNSSYQNRICQRLGLKHKLFTDERIKILEIHRWRRLGKSGVLN